MIKRFAILLLATLFLAIGACSSDDSSTAKGDGGTPLQDPPTRPITSTATPPDPDQAAAPTLAKMDPTSAALGSVGTTIILTGTGFIPRSVVNVDGTALDTTFESDTSLAATIPAEKLAALADLKITVTTPAPGGGTTAPLTFSVENPPPAILALSPLSIVAGSSDTTLTVVGTQLVKGTTIQFGGANLVTTFVDDQHVTGVIPAASLTVSKSVPVTVTTPNPGGGASTSIAFTISNPNATITSITPQNVLVGAADFPISVKGTGFVSGSVILFNGTALQTAPGAAGELTATIPASAVATTGMLPVTVQNPPPGGGVSDPMTLTVGNPAPVATSAAPASIAAGTGPTPVVITGSGFVSISKVTVNNIAGQTLFKDASHIQVTLTAANLLNVATLTLKVTTAGPGGGTSGPISFAVTAGTPKITSLDPSSAMVGSPDKAVVIHGASFVNGASATAGGQAIGATFVNGGQLNATIPASMLTKAGPLPIVVTNPGGPAPSGPVSFNVVCDTSNVNVALSDLTTVQTFTTDFANAPALSRWTSDGTCPNDTFSPVLTPQPARYAVVQNTTSAPVTMSAWADCTNDGKGAAFLTFYRRATAPANDTERLACEGFVAEGSPHLSPDSGGSATCPGLTKSNGGGFTLGVCERAIVHIQAFDASSSTLTPPPKLKIRAE